MINNKSREGIIPDRGAIFDSDQKTPEGLIWEMKY